MRAVLQYRNTPMQDCRRLPAQMVFGRQMRYFIPSLTYNYEPTKDWAVIQEHRERTLANKREMDNQRWSHRTKALYGWNCSCHTKSNRKQPKQVGQDRHHPQEQTH